MYRRWWINTGIVDRELYLDSLVESLYFSKDSDEEPSWEELEKEAMNSKEYKEWIKCWKLFDEYLNNHDFDIHINDFDEIVIKVWGNEDQVKEIAEEILDILEKCFEDQDLYITATAQPECPECGWLGRFSDKYCSKCGTPLLEVKKLTFNRKREKQ